MLLPLHRTYVLPRFPFPSGINKVVHRSSDVVTTKLCPVGYGFLTFQVEAFFLRLPFTEGFVQLVERRYVGRGSEVTRKFLVEFDSVRLELLGGDVGILLSESFNMSKIILTNVKASK